jgi:hypothetical protein
MQNGALHCLTPARRSFTALLLTTFRENQQKSQFVGKNRYSVTLSSTTQLLVAL